MSEHEDFRVSPALSRRLKRLGLVAAAVAGVVVVVGLGMRWYERNDVRRWTDARAEPVVALVAPHTSAASRELVLPGTVRAFVEAPIYARVGGYLKSWTTDIGARVRAGQVLATIETPELDQQLLQAKADLATARANEALSASTATRWRQMLTSDAVSRQEADEKAGDLAAKSAIVAAAEANVARLQATTAFKLIVAPFTGTITARRTDIGALINAGSGNGPELFRIADASKVRVYVDIPQSYSATIHVGSIAMLRVPERPDHQIQARVADMSRAISESSRTMLVQLEADNRDGTLLPGSYVDARFPLEGPSDIPRLPVSALIFRHQGLQLAVLDAENRVQMHAVRLGRDFGTEVEILGGLHPHDRIVDNPPDGLDVGARVRVAVPSAAREGRP